MARGRGRIEDRGLKPFVAGAIALVVIAIGVYFGFTKTNPFAKRFEMSAAFKNVNDLKKGSPVRIAGVNVGKVVKVEGIEQESQLGQKGGGAIVHMEIEDKGLPIHADATAKVRPRIFLEGNWFLDLHPGSPSAPIMKEGQTIAVQNTAAPVQFGHILNALQSDTRQDLQKVLDEYGRALADGGARGYNRSIDYWEGAFRDSAIVNEATLGTEEHDLSNYLRGATKFANGLDRDPQALKNLLTDFATTADAFADEEANLTLAIRELPKTLIAGRSALGELNDAFPGLRRFTAELRPAVRSSGPALDATLPLVKQLRGLVGKDELRGLVADLEEVVPDLVELNEGGVDVQKELRLLSSCTNNVLTPWRNSTVPDAKFPASGPVFQEQVKFFPGIAAESRNFDANGQYVRSLANGAQNAYPLGDGEFALSAAPILGVNPPKQTERPPLEKDVPCETQQPPDLSTTPGDPPANQVKINQNAVPVDVKLAQQKAAIEYMRELIKDSGMKGLTVSDDVLKPSEISKLAPAIPVKAGKR
jgi:virulence factor Mce-like protein